MSEQGCKPARIVGRLYEINGQVDSEAELPAPSATYLGEAFYVGTQEPREVYACVECNGTLQWQNQGILFPLSAEYSPSANASNGITFEELKAAAAPLVELLRKKGNYHTTATVTGHSITVTQDLMGVPLDYED